MQNTIFRFEKHYHLIRWLKEEICLNAILIGWNSVIALYDAIRPYTTQNMSMHEIRPYTTQNMSMHEIRPYTTQNMSMHENVQEYSTVATLIKTTLNVKIFYTKGKFLH